MKPQLPKTEFWTGTFHGSHDGLPAKVTATRDDTRPEPYAWTCTCGESRSFPTNEDVFDTAWRHTHPGPVDRLRQWATRRLRTRRSHCPDALPGPRPPRTPGPARAGQAAWPHVPTRPRVRRRPRLGESPDRHRCAH